jgi:hypothetical protein
MVAVAVREPVLEAATEDRPVRADGGVPLESFVTDDADDSPECDCDELPDDFPCWLCVRDSRRNLPGEGE